MVAPLSSMPPGLQSALQGASSLTSPLATPITSSPAGMSFASIPPITPSTSPFSGALPPSTAQLIDPMFAQTVPGVSSGTQNVISMINSMMSQAMKQPIITPMTLGSAASGPPPIRNGNGVQNRSIGTAAGDQLQRNLDLIAQDPEGQKLLAEAARRGVKIEVGNPATAQGANDVAMDCQCSQCGSAADASFALGDGVASGAVIHGVTLSDSAGNTRIVVADPNNIKTIVHELVHAVSTEDGNSREEEGTAEQMGVRITNRLNGIGNPDAASEQQTFTNKQRFYPGLNQSNNIRNTLASLGLDTRFGGGLNTVA